MDWQQPRSRTHFGNIGKISVFFTRMVQKPLGADYHFRNIAFRPAPHGSIMKQTLALVLLFGCLNTVDADIINFDFTSAGSLNDASSGTITRLDAGSGLSLDLLVEVFYFGDASSIEGELTATTAGLSVNTTSIGTNDVNDLLDTFTGGPIPAASTNRQEAIKFTVTGSSSSLDSLRLTGLDLRLFDGIADPADTTNSTDAGRIDFGASVVDFDENVNGTSLNIDTFLNEVDVNQLLSIGDSFLVEYVAGDGFRIEDLQFTATASLGASVPEPSSFAFVGFLVAGVALRRRFKSEVA